MIITFEKIDRKEELKEHFFYPQLDFFLSRSSPKESYRSF